MQFASARANFVSGDGTAADQLMTPSSGAYLAPSTYPRHTRDPFTNRHHPYVVAIAGYVFVFDHTGAHQYGVAAAAIQHLDRCFGNRTVGTTSAAQT